MTAAQLISFARGAPSLDIVDVDGLKAAAVRAFDADPGGVTAYGTSVGYLPLRKWIADKHGVAPEQVLVTNGSLQADAFLFDHLVQPRRRRGGRAADLRPHAAQPAQPGRARSTRSPLEPDGIDVDELRKLLESGVRPKLAHIIPNYQNPAGVTLSLAKRRALLDAGRASTASRSSRTTRTPTSGSAASRCRRCSRSTSTACVVHASPASPRRSARACGSATWSGRRR